MQLERIDDYRWLIPRTYKSGMLTDALVYASERLLEAIGAISLFPTSPYSFPEAWEQLHTSSWARKPPCTKPSVRPVMARAAY